MSAHHNDLWPDERTTKLVAMVAQGYSGGQIAAALGVTRNAIMGKIHRTGLRLTNEARKPVAIRRLIKRTTMKSKALGAAALSARRKPIPPPAPEIPPVDGPIGIMELTAFTCRWPIGERHPYRYCGTTKPADMAYCRAHTEIAVGHHQKQVSG